MQLSTTFRHMDASQAVREYAADKLEKIRKYFNKDPISAHAVFSVERGFHHVADLNITLPNGIVINAKETTEDMYSSIDLAAARIERQVRKLEREDPRPQAARRPGDVGARDGDPRRGDRAGADAGGDAAKPTPPARGRGTYQVVKDERFTARSHDASKTPSCS